MVTAGLKRKLTGWIPGIRKAPGAKGQARPNPYVAAFSARRRWGWRFARLARLRPASLTYVLLFTSRSGSSWLAGMAAQSGCLGNPQEYLNPDKLPAWRAGLEPCSLPQYLRAQQRLQVSDNGVFGTKANFFHIKHMDQVSDFLDVLQPDRFIYLTRRDFVAQGVSFWRATRTGYFHSVQSGKTAERIPFDADGIQRACNHVLEQEYGFERWLEAHRLTPWRITYEELIADPDKVLRGMAEFVLGEVPESFQPNSGIHEMVGDDFNLECARRFRAERAEYVAKWDVERGRQRTF